MAVSRTAPSREALKPKPWLAGPGQLRPQSSWPHGASPGTRRPFGPYHRSHLSCVSSETQVPGWHRFAGKAGSFSRVGFATSIDRLSRQGVAAGCWSPTQVISDLGGLKNPTAGLWTVERVTQLTSPHSIARC